MTLTLNFLDVTGTIADTEKLPGKLVPTLLRRIRMFDAKDLLPTIREETGRREGRLDLAGACSAVIYSELLDMGFDVELLRDLNRKLRQTHGKADVSAIVQIVEAVRQKANPVLVVALKRKSGSYEKHRVISLDGLTAPGRAAAASASLDIAAGISAPSVLRVDLAPLLADFIVAFEFAAATDHSED